MNRRRPYRRAVRVPVTHGVLICSYQRPEDLLRCLAALAQQRRPADDVIVVARESDTATLEAVRKRPADGLPLQLLTVTAPGKVCALNAGLEACRTDILSIADDDTIATPNWLALIFDHFVVDPALGGLGGRGRCHDGRAFDDQRRAVVGRLQWFGRPVGNHHLGFGDAQQVDFLKGANMSYRAEAFVTLRFDCRLRGQGAQPHEDFAFSLAVGRAGWKIAYDPAALIKHYTGQRDEPRHYVSTTPLDDAAGYFDCCYNKVIALWDELSPTRRMVYAVWGVLVGMRVEPGLVQAVRMTPDQGILAWRRLLICQRARLAAFATLMHHGERSTPKLPEAVAGKVRHLA